MQLIYLSPVPWASFPQRPHKFVEWFHATVGGSVLWIDPYPTRLPAWRDLQAVKRAVRRPTGERLPPWLTVVAPKSLPIEPLPGSRFVNGWFWRETVRSVEQAWRSGPYVLGIGKPSALGLQLLCLGGYAASFYDAMDDFPAFHDGLSRKSMAKFERMIGERVGTVMVSSSALATRWREHDDVYLARNACSPAQLPPVWAPVQKPEQTVLGYVGTIGRWFDWEMVHAMAMAAPESRVRLIGPVFSPPPGRLPRNVELLPACSHREAMRAMQGFSAGLIPFKRMRLTESVDPIKYYEYRAMGLPVISSLFGEMNVHRADPGVFLLEQAERARATIDAALGFRTTAVEIQSFRESNSWNARFSAGALLPGLAPAAYSRPTAASYAGFAINHTPA